MLINNALVILWSGTHCPDCTIGELTERLSDCVISNGDFKVVYKTDADVADIITENNGTSIVIGIGEAVTDIQESIESAVKLIGTMYEKELKEAGGKNYAMFALKLQKNVSDAKSQCGFNILSPHNYHRELWKAIEIIATVNGIIPKSLARKYRFSNSVVAIIKQIYTQFR